VSKPEKFLLSLQPEQSFKTAPFARTAHLLELSWKSNSKRNWQNHSFANVSLFRQLAARAI
jgi:hypothetical protein